ncbi:MAG: hypothetical protein KDD29_01715 [Flavobacteriales bacterium]|nr:hypothetical protein [Flavobacteriales bacterium]
MIKKGLVFSMVLSILFACNSTQINEQAENSEEVLVDEEEDELLSEIYELEEEDNVELEMTNNQEEETGFRATTARIAQNYHDFSLIISENYGVYVITQPGAMPNVEHLYELKESKFSSEVFFEELPKVVCNEQVYDKDGCFAQEINPLIESQIWNYTKMNEKEKQAIIAMVEKIKYTVIDTKNKTTYYFSEVDGEWFLTFIDKRVPCEA